METCHLSNPALWLNVAVFYPLVSLFTLLFVFPLQTLIRSTSINGFKLRKAQCGMKVPDEEENQKHPRCSPSPNL